MAGGATDPEAERLKGQGNEKLKAGSAREALEIYEKALARLPVKASAGALSTLSASLCLNAALACLQLETWEAAESFASRALRSEETSKGYFRRGLARAQMNGLEADAKRDFEFALKLEPKGSTAAVLVQTELAKLLSNSAASGYEAPPGTEPRRAKKFQIANASKQQQGLREVTFAEWEALEGKVAAANAIASAWRKRLEEASNCPRPAQGADDSLVPLSKLLEQLAKESKPRAASNASALASDIVPVEVALGSEPASGAIRGELGALQLLVPGPFLFDGKTSVDVAFDPLANPTGSFAVECWAVCTAATGHQCLLSSRDQTSGKAGYMFYVEPDGLWSFWVGTGKSWAKLYGSTAVLGKWTHLRGTMDVQSKEARLYVDHQLAARGWASYVPNTRQALRLGAGKSEAEAKFFFTGDLRDVAVIGRLVSNEDLTDEMLKLAKVRGPQVGPDLDQLPKLLRQEKGRGLQNASGALASALRWATDALVRDLKNEILELRKQLEQAKEKHDDEALKEIADHLEASHAIVAAQTRDWVDFEEENAELSKKRARSFIRSSSHEMFPYLANHSEDPHLCFKLVMHVPEGKEQSLGSDISSDFRLPPALGVCETTGYIRNQGGCLTLRPAAAPSGRSGRFASIEVNGNKLSREQKLHHLDCVLFGRSTSFYVFLQHASAEEVDERLRASRADMEDWDGRITQPLVDKILGEARSKDPAEVKLAREYCDLLRGQNRDSEGELMLRAFMCQARRARVKVDEANELTRCVRPSSGLHFELAAQAPVLSYGFYRCANLPELCVRLVRRTRFRAAVRKVMAQLKKQNLIQAAVRSFLPAKSESFSSDYQLLSTWTLPKFYARLEMMYEVRQNQLDDPSIKLEKLDKWKDPWAECGVAEVEALQEEHRLQIEDLRDRNRKRETEIQEAAQQQLQRLQEELKAANAELLRRNDKPREVEAEGRPTPPGFNGAQAPGLVARCLELGKANKALLESLCVEQREGFEP